MDLKHCCTFCRFLSQILVASRFLCLSRWYCFGCACLFLFRAKYSGAGVSDVMVLARERIYQHRVTYWHR
jgi:hypothetical protein